jgi:hypothetical protein
MYKKKYLGILFVLLAVGLMLAFTMLWGCSSDSTSSPIVQGDLDDPIFTAIRENLDNVIDSIAGKVHDPLTNPWGFPLDSSTWTNPEDNIWWGPQNPADSVDYNYSEDGWHTMYVYQLTASGSQIFYDSVAFYMFGVPIENYSGQTQEIKYRGSCQREIDNGDQLTTIGYTIRADYENVGTYISSATGTAVIGIVDEYTESGSDIIEQYDFDISFEEIQFTRSDLNGWSNYESIDGDVMVDMTYAAQTTTGGETENFDQNWTIEVSIEENVAHINATQGNTRWTYDHNL